MKRNAIDNGTPQGQFVSILQFVAHRNATGNGGETNGQALQTPRQIETCRVALHGGAQRHNHFVDITGRHALDQ